jgi:hypothetical protein
VMTQDNRIKKFIRMLASATDAEVLMAARGLTVALQADGKDFNDLADLTDRWPAAQPARPRATFDFIELQKIVERFADGKAKVTRKQLWRAVVADKPELDAYDAVQARREVSGYVIRHLSSLGFKRTSEMTWTRGGSTR